MTLVLPVAIGDGEGDHAKHGGGAMRATTQSTVSRARILRRNMSKPEAALGQVLRARPAGLKFRRQHPIGRYVLDFYCPKALLAIEVDGIAHDMGDNPGRDRRRDEWLRARGLRVVRLLAGEVLSDIEGVVREITQLCLATDSPSTSLRLVPLPTPSAQGGQE